MNLLKQIFKNYFAEFGKFNDSSSRTNRFEFWSFMLINSLLMWLIIIINFWDGLTAIEGLLICVTLIIGAPVFWKIVALIAIILISPIGMLFLADNYDLKMLNYIFIICLLPPIPSLFARRLNDVGRSWHWLWLLLYCAIVGIAYIFDIPQPPLNRYINISLQIIAAMCAIVLLAIALLPSKKEAIAAAEPNNSAQ